MYKTNYIYNKVEELNKSKVFWFALSGILNYLESLRVAGPGEPDCHRKCGSTDDVTVGLKFEPWV